MRIQTEKTVKDMRVICDFCKGDHYMGRVQQCRMCDKDVCFNCSEQTEDGSNLRTPGFHGDYPDFICKPCWKKGEELRNKIQDARDAAWETEEILFREWKKICQNNQQTTG